MKFLSVLILVVSAFAQFQQTGNYTITGLASTSTVNTPSTPKITTLNLPNGTQNTFYSATLTESGGTAPFCYSVISGFLPAGLSLNTGTISGGKCTVASTGLISGTPTTVGTSSPNFQVTDGNGLTGTALLPIVINPNNVTLVLQAATLPQVSVGGSYNSTLLATGGATPYQLCSITVGALPAGISISVTNGTPAGCLLSSSNVTAAAGTYTFTAQITDNLSATASQSYSITVTSGPPTSYGTPLCQQNTTPPYTGNCSAWPVVNTPNFGGLLGKGTCINDYRTGATLLRLTDSSISNLTMLNTSDYGLNVDVNANDTLGLVSNVNGADWVVPFNNTFGSCSVGTPIKISSVDSGQYNFDFSNPNVFYDLPLNGTGLKKCTVATATNSYSCIVLFDFADNPGTTPHGSGGLLPGYHPDYIATGVVDSKYDNNGTFNPGHVWGAAFGGGPPWAQNGPYGTTWQLNWVVRPVNNNTGKFEFRVTACAGSCIGGSTEPTWSSFTTIGATLTDGNITWTNIGAHNQQDWPMDLVMYDSAANCFTHLDLVLGQVLNTNCAGQSTGALTYLHFGTTTTKGVHAGGGTLNASYMRWGYAGSWTYVWSPGTLTVDYCVEPAQGGIPTQYCDGHAAEGVAGYYSGAAGIRFHPWNNPNSASNNPVLMGAAGGRKLSYGNANSTDTTPICTNTTNAGFHTLNYTQPFYTEVACFATDGTTDVYRMFQTYNSNIHWSYHVQDSSTNTSSTGKALMFTTDMEGTLGSDKGHNTCTAGDPGCASNPTTGDTCIQGGDGWQLSTAYSSGTVINPGIIISTSGFPQASGNKGHYTFKATNSGTSSATNTITWCQTPPTAWNAGNGCTTVDNNITWQNIGQIDCRGDVFIGELPSNTKEDMITWMMMTNRTTNFMSGTNSEGSWKDADGEKIWHIKCGTNCTRGYPWDIRTYDTNWVNWWVTDNSFTLDPSAYKRFVTPVPLVPRFLPTGTSFDTGELPGPNTININAGGGGCTETSTNLGHIHGVTSGPTNTVWNITNVGTVTLPTMEVDYYWGGTNGSSIYNTRERYYFAKPYGLLKWDTSSWNGSGYTVNQTSLFTTLNTNAGAATPQFTCSNQSWWIGGQPGVGGNAP